MHGTQAHVLIDGRMVCTGDEAVFFDIIQKNGFKCALFLSVIPSYFRSFSCDGKCDACPEKERHNSGGGRVASRLVIHQELESKRTAKLDAFLNSTSQPVHQMNTQMNSQMEEEPSKAVSLLAAVEGIADDSFMTETTAVQTTPQQGGVVKIDVNDAGG